MLTGNIDITDVIKKFLKELYFYSKIEAGLISYCKNQFYFMTDSSNSFSSNIHSPF